MMKRIAWLLTAIPLLLLPACSPQMPSPYGDIPKGEIVFYTQFTEYQPDTDVIDAVLQNGANDTLTLGSPWTIEQKRGNNWYTLPFQQDTTWHDLAYEILPGGSYQERAHIGSLAQQLTPGEYRLVKVINGAPVAAEFTVSEDAFRYEPLSHLPKRYTAADAEADGVVMIQDTLSDAERLREFFTHRALGFGVQIRLGRETDAGLILTDVTVDADRLNRITLTTDATRAGGEVTVQYFSHIVYFNGDIFLANTPQWKGALESQTALFISENAAGQAAYGIEPWLTTPHLTRPACFWSSNGLSAVSLLDRETGFALHQYDEDGGYRGQTVDIPAEYKMRNPLGAVWDSDNRHVVLIYETEDSFGYVFYDTQDKKFTGYTHSHYHYTVDSDGHILIPE